MGRSGIRLPLLALASSLPLAAFLARVTGAGIALVLPLLLGGLLLAAFVCAWAAVPERPGRNRLAHAIARGVQFLVGLVAVALVVQGLLWGAARWAS